MSNHDQCPTSRKEGKPVHQTPVGARALQVASTAASGKAYWRGLEEVADTPEFRDWLEREFPAGASELDAGGQNRRTFLKLMGASLALAVVAERPGALGAEVVAAARAVSTELEGGLGVVPDPVGVHLGAAAIAVDDGDHG
jgi:MoCo/4Fe-4S cofactor protein with predicted Tat translocation signal